MPNDWAFRMAVGFALKVVEEALNRWHAFRTRPILEKRGCRSTSKMVMPTGLPMQRLIVFALRLNTRCVRFGFPQCSAGL